MGIEEDEINNDSVKVYAVQNGVVIESSGSIPVNVYSISGNLLYEGLSDNKSYIELEQGLYIVKAGDTLWDIAKKFYTTVDEISGVNSLTEKEVKPGQSLILVRQG